MRRALLAVGIVVLVSLPLRVAGAQPEKEEDPWIGTTRAEVIDLLGKAHKAKSGRDGEKLTYKFFRIDPDAPVPLDMRLIPVPGLGVVAKAGERAADDSTGVAIGPTEFDKHGRATSGGVAVQETATASYSTKTGKFEQSGPRGSVVRGKVKLMLTLDGSGRVTAWSVSGKK